METQTYDVHVPRATLGRYHWFETRAASAVFAATSPAEWAELMAMLDAFTLTVTHLLQAGGNKSTAAKELDDLLRTSGWREVKYEINVSTVMKRSPYKAAGESSVEESSVEVDSSIHKIDNVKGRLAVEVEWNPKDGNLDRDLAAMRSMYDLGFIDVGVIIMRHQAETKALANTLATQVPGYATPGGTKLLSTSTTANFEKAVARLLRGDAAGCPVLLVGVGKGTYTPGLDYSFVQKIDGVPRPFVGVSPDV